ncbi:GumC family protein [Aestuariibacter salexigens]|uniref:GumC family protein n=1 Tax=Aestuariibacter salexigens TaxID=226010 RepID=UPI000428FB39|nr:sugar transporter [Aestuariibacter salexigens]
MTVRQQLIRLFYIALYAMYRRIRLFVVPFLILPVIVILHGATAEKRYINHASVLLEESALLNPFLDELSFSFELKDRIDALKTLVLSRGVISEVALKTGLVDDTTPLLEKELIHEKLSQNLAISMVGDELVRIQFNWHEPHIMKNVLEQVVEAFIDKLLAPTKTSLDTSEQFFEAQLQALRADLEAADSELAVFRKQHRSELPQLFMSNQETLQTVEAQRQLKSVHLSGIKARLDMLEKKLGKANPVLGLLEDNIIRAESELALLKTRYTDKHSKVINVKRQIETLKTKQGEIVESADDMAEIDIERLWQIANTLPGELHNGEPNLLVTQIVALQEARNQHAQVLEEMAMLDAQVEELTQRLTQSSDVDKTLRKMERDYEVKSDLYRDMLSRYEMAKLTGKLVRYEGPDKVKQIERAYSPTRSINAPLSITAIIGVILGIFAGLLFVFVAEMLDPTIKDKVTVEKLISRPVIAILPLIEAGKNNAVAATMPPTHFSSHRGEDSPGGYPS